MERKSSEKRGGNKRIRLISHLCDIQEVDSDTESGRVEVTYIEEPTLTMSTCVDEGTYDPRREKNCFLHMRKQRRRSASR